MWSGVHGSGVDGHPGYGVHAHPVERVDLCLGADASGDDQLAGGGGAEGGGDGGGEALHGAFGVDVGVEEGGAEVLEPGDCFLGREGDGVLPAADGDASVFCVDGEDECVFSEVALEGGGEGLVDAVRGEEGGAEDDAAGAGVEECAGVFGGAEAATDLAGEALAEHFDEGAVRALSHGGVEVDELDEGVRGEAFDPGLEVIEGELEFFAVDELDDLAAEEVDGGDEHLCCQLLALVCVLVVGFCGSGG